MNPSTYVPPKKRIGIPRSAQIKTLSGVTYYANAAGTRIRISPVRPWRGKSERRAVIKARRLDREAAAQNF